jgi:hypothetical protein
VSGKSLPLKRGRFRVPFEQVPVRAAIGRAVRAARRKEHFMLDVIMLAIGLGFFALSVGYTIACDRL